MAMEFIGRTILPLKSCTMHTHDFWELIYNVKGRGMQIIDGRQTPFQEGSVVLCPPGVPHRKFSDQDFEDYFILLSECNLPSGVSYVMPRQSSELLQLIRIMYSCFHGYGQNGICDQLLEVVMQLLEPELDGAICDAQIREARRIIVSRFADANFRLSEVAGQLHMNEDHFRRRFKQVMGLCPHQYLQNIRVENAKKLLRSPGSGMSVADVAYLSGFYDALYFSKVFRKQVGQSPSDWSRNQKQTDEQLKGD